jgi:hypothetical protein
MSWRTGTLVREAWLNVVTSPWRTGGLVLAVAAIFGGLAGLELRDANELTGFETSFVASGGYVALGLPSAGTNDSAARCEALNGQPGVAAAGGVYSPELTTFETAPGVLFQRAAVTEGALRVWDPGLQREPAEERQFVAGLALAEETGLRVGSYAIPEAEEPALVTAVADVERRNPQVARWALEVSPPDGAIEQCWVEFEPGAYEGGLAALPAIFTSGDETAAARPYIRSDEFTRDPAAEWAARPQRNGWPLAAALVAGLFALTAWFRRSELGLYLAVGTPRGALMGMLAVEALLVVGFATVLAVAYAFAFDEALRHSPGWDESRIVVRTVGSAALLAIAIAPVLGVLVVRGSIAELLKDR